MASLPIGQNQDARTSLPDNGCDFQTILPGIFHAPVGNIESTSPLRAQNGGRIGSLACALFRGSARSHLSLREIQDAGALSALRGFQQCSATGLLHVIAVRGKR